MRKLLFYVFIALLITSCKSFSDFANKKKSKKNITKPENSVESVFLDKRQINNFNNITQTAINKESEFMHNYKIYHNAELISGEKVPVAQRIPRHYMRDTLVMYRAVLNNSDNIFINVDNHGYVSAYIELPNDQRALIPNGHYEVIDHVIRRLPPYVYHLSSDRSMLLSIYNGNVINYLPKVAIENNEFIKFVLNK